MLSANQNAEIFVCILLSKKLFLFMKIIRMIFKWAKIINLDVKPLYQPKVLSKWQAK